MGCYGVCVGFFFDRTLGFGCVSGVTGSRRWVMDSEPPDLCARERLFLEALADLSANPAFLNLGDVLLHEEARRSRVVRRVLQLGDE